MAEVRKEHSPFSRTWKIWKDKDISFKSSSICWHGTAFWEKISWTKQMTREFDIICIKYLINCWPKRYKNDQKLNFLSILLPPLPDAREFHIFTYLFLFPFRSGGKFSSWGRTQEAWGSAPLHRVTVFPRPREIRPCTFYKGIIFEIIKKFWFMNVFSLGKTGWLNTFFSLSQACMLGFKRISL